MMMYYLTLTRSCEVAVIAWAFTVSCLTTRDFIPSPSLLWALLSVITLYSGGNILTEVYRKRLLDRLYHGTAEFRRDSTLALALLFTALLFSAAGGINLSLSMVILILIIYFHARNIKNLGLLRNLFSAFIGSSIFILAMQFTGQAGLNLFLFAIFLFFVMAEELLRDIDEIENDMKSGIHTFPIHYGIPHALIAASAFMAAGISLAFALYSLGNFRPLLLGTSLFMLLVCTLLYRYQGSIKVSHFRLAIIGIMVLFLTGILLSYLH
jgi:4-hydroxybenzoate polyprenyltransferase